MERKVSRLASGRIVDITEMSEGEPPLIYVSLEEGWVTYEGDMAEVWVASPLTGQEYWRAKAYGEFDTLCVGPEARKRIYELAKLYKKAYPVQSPGFHIEAALTADISAWFKKQKDAAPAESEEDAFPWKQWPMSLEEAADEVLSHLNDASKKSIGDLNKGELSSFHFPFGRHIRNRLGLWKSVPQGDAARYYDPDWISAEILAKVWERLQESPNKPDNLT